MAEPRQPFFSNPLVARAARWGVVAWAAIGIGLGAYLAYRYLLFPVRIVFPPLILALLIVYLLNPTITRIEDGGLRRGWATLLSYVVFLAVVTAVLLWLVPVVSDQVTSFARSVPDLVHRFQAQLARVAARLGISVRVETAREIRRSQQNAAQFFGRLTSFTSGVVHLAIVLVLGPVLAFYLLVDLPKFRRWARSAIPGERRAEAEDLGREVSRTLGGYFRGQLLVALFVGVASMAGLYVVGLPYWAIVGLIAGLFNLVPLIGPVIGALPALFVAFTASAPAGGFLVHPRTGWPLALAASAVLFLVQLVDNNLISPRLVERTVRLHPLTVMLSLLAAGSLFGLWGMLLAIPAVATAKILLIHYWDTRMTWPPSARRTEDARPPPAPAPREPVAGPEPWWRRWWGDRGGSSRPPRTEVARQPDVASGPPDRTGDREGSSRPPRIDAARQSEAEGYPSSAETASEKPSPAGEGVA